MVIFNRTHRSRKRARGTLNLELLVAISILIAGLLPLSATLFHDQKRIRVLYRKAVAMEIVDGEMEILAAGEWRSFQPGTHPYPVNSDAATNLAAGTFTLTRGDDYVRLQWEPANRGQGGRVAREFKLPQEP